MKSIEFLGAAGEVTGSSYVVTSDDGNQVLVDLGMFQGPPALVKKNYEMLAFKPSDLQAVFLTHAHLDHSGRLPLLVFGGFMGHVYMTEPTLSLMEIILTDSARIAEKDNPDSPLYTSDEVRKLLSMVRTVHYNTPISLGSFEATFRDAGHILGSSSIEIVDLKSPEKTLAVFSGDLGNFPQDIVKPTQFIEKADIVVMESTYGDSDHPAEDPKEVIREEINEVEKTGGVLLIPSFALERTQELLHIIHHLKKDGVIRAETPVFLDSPMGIDATSIYLEFQPYYNEHMQSHTDIPFNFEGVVITDQARDSRDIVNAPPPKVIIAGSGMMAGGRILHHAINYLPLSSTRVLFVGYQGEDTMGREILEGAQQVVVNDTVVKVKATVREIKTLSSHADQTRLLTWLGHISGVKTVFLTHGDSPQREVLKEKIQETMKIKSVILPQNGEIHNL